MVSTRPSNFMYWELNPQLCYGTQKQSLCVCVVGGDDNVWARSLLMN